MSYAGLTAAGVSVASRNNRFPGPCVRKQELEQYHRVPEEADVTEVRSDDNILACVLGITNPWLAT